MYTYAIQKQIHISPRKLGLVCDLIRGKNVKEAQKILLNLDKKSSKIVYKVLNSAISNATHNMNMDINKLYVLNALANQGSTLKRTIPRAKGSANLLRKRHSHLTIFVSNDVNDKNQLHKKHKHFIPNISTEVKTKKLTNIKISSHELPEVEEKKKIKITPKTAVKEAIEIEKKEENK